MRNNWDITSSAHHHIYDNAERFTFLDVSQNSWQSGQIHYDQFLHVRQHIAANRRPINTIKIYNRDGDEASMSIAARRSRLRLRTLPENRAANRAALAIKETAWLRASRFLFIRLIKPPARHMDVLFVRELVAQNGRDCDSSIAGRKCLNHSRIRQIRPWPNLRLTGAPVLA